MLYGFCAQEFKGRSSTSDAAARSTQNTSDHRVCGDFSIPLPYRISRKNTPNASRRQVGCRRWHGWRMAVGVKSAYPWRSRTSRLQCDASVQINLKKWRDVSYKIVFVDDVVEEENDIVAGTTHVIYMTAFFESVNPFYNDEV